jgi:hypothetical protein
MPDYEKRLYMVVFPINALISSQLDPEKFGEHFTSSSSKHFSGKVIFAEIDMNYRHPYFDIDKYLDLTVPHEDGSPKRTKFISVYRVLEHVDLDAIKKLYLVTTNGKALPLEPAPYTQRVYDPKILRIYQEITPLENLIVSTFDQTEFGKFITTQTKSKGCPKICFTQIDFDIENFLESNKNKELFKIDLPGVNPYRFYDCIMELKNKPEKYNKTINLGGILREISYKFLKRGFWFAEGDKIKFFPMPNLNDLENKYFYWWKFVR